MTSLRKLRFPDSVGGWLFRFRCKSQVNLFSPPPCGAGDGLHWFNQCLVFIPYAKKQHVYKKLISTCMINQFMPGMRSTGRGRKIPIVYDGLYQQKWSLAKSCDTSRSLACKIWALLAYFDGSKPGPFPKLLVMTESVGQKHGERHGYKVAQRLSAWAITI